MNTLLHKVTILDDGSKSIRPQANHLLLHKFMQLIGLLQLVCNH